MPAIKRYLSCLHRRDRLHFEAGFCRQLMNLRAEGTNWQLDADRSLFSLGAVSTFC